MRWLKYGLLAVLLILGVYALAMYYFADESKSFKVEREVNYPLDKVFPQFSNLQNFARWNLYFSGSRKFSIQFYTPYEGQGAALSFQDQDDNRKGEMFIRYVNPNSTIKYQLFEGKQSNPYRIDLKFKALPNGHTKISWYIFTPKQTLLNRSANFFTEADFVDDLNASMKNLTDIMGNKVDKDKQMAAIKYDSLMVEEEEGHLLLGVNVSTSNKGDGWFKNIVLNHNKVYNFVTVDLSKREDEFGFPVMITEPGNFKDKEVSYFYGIPLSKRQSVSDNNFSFRTINPSKYYTLYYKGKFAGRVRAIQQLLNKAKKDTMRNGELQQTFLEPPTEGTDVNMKLSLPVYR